MEEAMKVVVPAVVGLVGALSAYLKTKNERAKTKVERDNSEINLEHRITTLETKVSDLGDLKQEVREMSIKLSELCGIVKSFEIYINKKI